MTIRQRRRYGICVRYGGLEQAPFFRGIDRFNFGRIGGGRVTAKETANRRP